jgi:hypothetical protein
VSDAVAERLVTELDVDEMSLEDEAHRLTGAG